jgi:hypothetical protein
MVNAIDIHDITLEELSGVVSLYPWYAGARMELCHRMAEAGALSESQVAETALHLCERKAVTSLLRAGRTVDCSDKDTRRLVETIIQDTDAQPQAPAPRYVVAGGDYFSQDQYETVRRDGDSVFARFAAKARSEGYTEEHSEEETNEGPFCTETLARIYLEQGYPQEAIDIYSRLCLRYPEKSVYFAALIDEINKKDN